MNTTLELTPQNRYALDRMEDAFEDGTVNYLNIPAIKTGLQHLAKVKIDTIF